MFLRQDPTLLQRLVHQPQNPPLAQPDPPFLGQHRGIGRPAIHRQGDDDAIRVRQRWAKGHPQTGRHQPHLTQAHLCARLIQPEVLLGRTDHFPRLAQREIELILEHVEEAGFGGLLRQPFG
ncbi:MAG: hypothetical protein NT169_11775 [Chloroflexi bacterium]|nr:hypothetical protein [Chloroflexota bacterium]